MAIIALVPAHNEARTITESVDGLHRQSVAPDRIVVIADNCTDDTEALARQAGAEVFVTVGNTAKKAGGLNQALARLDPELASDDVVLVQDADSILDPEFIEHAMPYVLSATYGAVGGVFRGEGGSGFVGHLQRNEYARYARDVKNLGGKCLVVTGTASMFRVQVLREVVAGRSDGTLPPGSGVYDTTVLTEDNELSFAIQTLGYKLISPRGCYLVTEIMPTWRELWSQRLRWKRGALENCLQYGITKTTWKYWGRQGLTAVGLVVSLVYLGTIVFGVTTGTLQIHLFWLSITGIFMIERAVTVRAMGWRQTLLSLTLYELVLDFFLQVVHTKAFADVALQRERRW